MKPWYRRRAIWRLVAGPLLTAATACTLLSLARSGIRVPAPGGFILGAIFVASYMGGAPAGYLSAALGIGFGSALLTEPGLLFVPEPEFRLLLLVGCGLILPLVVSQLRNRSTRHLESERAMRERAEAANRELLTLRAELVRHAQELERLATLDDLTGLCNRRHFLALAEDERSRHAREQRPMAVLIFDIDLFKSVNDRFGHDAGDAVIRHVADVCRGEIGESDILARFGGEEFVLLLPESTGEQAAARADAMRQRLEATAFEVDGVKVRVTVSIGVAEAATQTECIGDLMKRADQALYQAKRDGRNRVRSARRASPESRDQIAAASAAA
jgi:diguanylate cyclase (GGDEF)-like protein